MSAGVRIPLKEISWKYRRPIFGQVLGFFFTVSGFFLLSFAPSDLYAQIKGRCVPTPPCYCREECFRYGPGGRPTPQPSYPSPEDLERRRQEEELEQKRLDEERGRQEAEEARRLEEFEKKKHDALKLMTEIQSSSDFDLNGKTSAPATELMEFPDSSAVDLRSLDQKPIIVDPGKMKGAQVPRTDPPEVKIRKEIDAAKKRSARLQKEISGMQTLLRQYSQTMIANTGEFQKWEATVNESVDRVMDNSKEYLAGMFINYNLLGSLERSVQKDVFRRLDRLINSTDPEMKRWMGEQLKGRKVELERLKLAIDLAGKGGDLTGLLSGDRENAGKSLDALLFINDLLETTKILKWGGGVYFQQAKMIGETYADLAAIGYGWHHIRRFTADTEKYNREIKSLAHRMESKVEEMSCLDRCINHYTNKCVDHCAGKTRFSTPPPFPR